MATHEFGIMPTAPAAGKSEEEIAQTMHRRRRELGRQYKEAAPPW